MSWKAFPPKTFKNFARVAVAVPPVKVADLDYNTENIISFSKGAEAHGANLVVFPELSITSYTLGDLVHSDVIFNQSLEKLAEICRETANMRPVIVVGLPLVCQGNIMLNVAAVIHRGKVHGFVPKTYQPNYKEFYEERWYASARDLKTREIEVNGEMIPIGTDLIFKLGNTGAILGIEVCEDVWVTIPPSSFAVLAGANIIANLSTSNDLVAKADYRRDLVRQQSAKGICAYAYASSGPGESSTDLSFGGHAMVSENGSLLAESELFVQHGTLTLSDIDLDHLRFDRIRTNTFGDCIHEAYKPFRQINIPVEEDGVTQAPLKRSIDPHPFVPSDPSKRNERAREVFAIQTSALTKRLRSSGVNKVVLGLSGGLDSTLVLLAAVKAFRQMGLPLRNILTVTMPGFGTTSRTRENAWKLAEALGVSIKEISIRAAVLQHFKDIGHDPNNQDVVFQNAQARERTQILMDLANKEGGLVAGTGDMSEIALGWCTYGGDHISMYNVNCGVPKTLVKYLVQWVSEQPDFTSAKESLKDILDTPISPELTGGENDTQKTEDIVGPYELHDFFLYHFVRWGSSPLKIMLLAKLARFDVAYTDDIILKWLRVFVTRFFKNQFKRSVATDGPKVGSVSLSPRGDWRMPSDAEVDLWLKEVDAIDTNALNL